MMWHEAQGLAPAFLPIVSQDTSGRAIWRTLLGDRQWALLWASPFWGQTRGVAWMRGLGSFNAAIT